MLHSWAGANTADLQLAVLCYVRQLAERLHEYGVTAAAVDMGRCTLLEHTRLVIRVCCNGSSDARSDEWLLLAENEVGFINAVPCI